MITQFFTKKDTQATGFGTFTGVIVPNITMMCGVILFLRLGLVLGNVGLYSFLAIILLSTVVMSITALSISMVCSNMRVGGGGAYFLISRSLGIEAGGAIGLALVLNQLLCMVLCVSGFAQSLHMLIPHYPLWAIEVVTLAVLGIIALVSTDLVLKTQTFIFACLVFAVGAIFLGKGTLPPMDYPFTSFSFWTGFAIFYPALTGIEVGMSLSGTLRNPSRSLSIGTITSLLVMALCYALLAIAMWTFYPRELLANNPNVLLNFSKFPAWIYFGVWCASLSSAIGNFIGAPRMIQTIAEDGVLPSFLGKGFGKHQEPRWAILLVFIIGCSLLVITTIDQLLPMLTMICLLTYGTLNLVAGLAEWMHNTSWRPSFRCPWQVCLAGSALCYYLMIMIQPGWALLSILLIVSLFLFLSRRNIQASFNDLRESLLISLSRFALYKLFDVDEQPQNWMPKVLICARAPMPYQKMIHMGHALTKQNGILTVASLVPEEWETSDQLDRTQLIIKDWLEKEKIKGINEVSAHADFYEGVNSYMKSYGIGSLQPNCVLLNFPDDEANKQSILQIVETASTYNKNLLFSSFPDNNDFDKKQKRIHLWWDQEERESSELMISLLLSLRKSRRWQKKELVVHCMATDENAKKHIEGHLEEMFKERRMSVEVQIHLDPRTDPLYYLSYTNKEAHLVLFPMRLNHLEQQQRGPYLERLYGALPSDTAILAGACFESLSHKEIYHTQKVFSEG
jgi:amino acid transporter